MPLTHASRLGAVLPSATLAMAAEAAKIASQGHKVYSFSVGEPDFKTPEHVIAAAKAALDAGATRYTAVTGTADLKAAIVEATKRDRGHTIDPKQITVSCGAKHALMNLASALYEAGDEVVIPAPYWVSYPEQVRLMGATPVIAETTAEQGFILHPEELEKRVTARTKAVILCTPSNPTGAAYTREALMGLVEVMRRGDYYVVVDEIYADLVYGDFKHTSLAALAPDLAERLIVIDGVSKTYAMTGWRIGWSITNTKVAGALSTIQGQGTTNPAAVSQAAAAAALRGPRDSIELMRTAFARRRDLMVKQLTLLPGVRCAVPDGAFYAFADFREVVARKLRDGASGEVIDTDDKLAMWLLRTARVASVAGTSFGAPGFLRLSYACSDEDIVAGLAAIGEALASAKS